jgi:hypothetical protein
VRVDVGEGDALPVFVDAGGGNASVDDLAKQTIHNRLSVARYPCTRVVVCP